MKKRIIFALSLLLVVACGKKQTSEPVAPVAQTDKTNRVEVLYFHGKQRCVTCNTIERLTKEVIDSSFADAVQRGDLVLKVIDISKSENEAVADKYQITWSSLLINQWKDGKESVNNMSDFGFTYAKGSPAEFKKGVRNKIQELINQ